MQLQTARSRRVDVVVLGRGLVAAALTIALAERGKTVALLVERTADNAIPPASELTALYEQTATFAKCYCVVGTWVRGISVIDNVILGAIAEEARYDSRIVINASQDERYAAYARMMRHPTSMVGEGVRIASTSVKGAWQLEGVPLAAEISALATAAAEQIIVGS